MKRKTILKILLVSILLLTGCSVRTPIIQDRDGAPTDLPDMSHVPDAVPRSESPSRYGNPDSYEVFGKLYRVMPSSRGYVARGKASWYGTKFHGRRTSSGEAYDMYTMTAAHKRLPLPTYVHVLNLENGRGTIVRVNDRGPFHDDRLLDLSYAAASKLGIVQNGTATVEIRAIDPPTSQRSNVTSKLSTPAATREMASTKISNAKFFFLQAGAFSSHANALRLRDRLEKSLTRDVRVHSPDDGSGLHKVRIGPLASRAQADSVASQLHGMGLANAQVVSD